MLKIYGTSRLWMRHGVRWLACLCTLVGTLTATAVTHRYHVVTDTDYGPLSVEQFSGGSWSHHISLSWYGPAYGSGAGYQVDATLPDNTSFTVRVVGGGLPGGTPLNSQTFNSGTSFGTTSWDPNATPDPYKFKLDLTNDSDQVRIVMYDIDCDGSYEERVTLFPGQHILREMEFEEETNVCVDSGRMGPDGEMIKDTPLLTFDSGDMEQTSGTPSTTEASIKPGDTAKPSPATPGSIEWSPESEGDAILTTKEGLGTVRSTIVETGKDQSELLRQIVTNTASLSRIGTTSNATESATWRLGILDGITNTTVGGYGTAKAKVEEIAESVYLPTSTDWTWMQFTLGGETVDFSPPNWPQSLQDLRSWVYHAVAWICWCLLGAAMFFRGREALHALLATPAAQTSWMAWTGAISPFTLAVGAVALGILCSGVAVVATSAVTAWTHAAMTNGPFLNTWPALNNALALAAHLAPLGDMFGCAFAYLAYEIIISLSTFLAGISLRALSH